MIGIGFASHQLSHHFARAVQHFILRKQKQHAVSLLLSLNNMFSEPFE